MEHIPTAEEFYLVMTDKKLCSEEEIMIEFAKMHVKAALSCAWDNAEMTDYRVKEFGGTEYNFPYPSKESIINSYPLENIK